LLLQDYDAMLVLCERIQLMGNFYDEICVDCNENLVVDFMRCMACKIDHEYTDLLDFNLTLDWNE
jgi:hypothetical protein